MNDDQIQAEILSDLQRLVNLESSLEGERGERFMRGLRSMMHAMTETELREVRNIADEMAGDFRELTLMIRN